MEKADYMEVITGKARQILLFLLSFFLYYNGLWSIGLFDGLGCREVLGKRLKCFTGHTIMA